MEVRWELRGAGNRLSTLKQAGAPGQPAVLLRSVLTVQDLCRRLRRSRRQIYRYLKAGRITASARILGQWLFSAEEARLFEKARVPSFLRLFFWDVRVSDLSAEHHRDFILTRLLESGDRAAVRWTFETYPKRTVLAFLRGRGAATLSKRARNFWLFVLGGPAPGKGRGSWRLQGRSWGGIPP